MLKGEATAEVRPPVLLSAEAVGAGAGAGVNCGTTTTL